MGLSSFLGGVSGGLLGTSKGANTTTNAPWNPAQKYILGDANTKGILPEAQSIYTQGAWSPKQQQVADQYGMDLGERYGGQTQAVNDFGGALLGGAYSPKLENISNTSYSPVELTKARSAQGALDPTQALSRTLSGRVDNPAIQSMQRAATRGAERQYDDAIETMTEQYLPAIRGNAIAAGGYGGSRQGIAEGLLGKQLARNARDLGVASMDAGANLYGTAYENAQGRMANTANTLNAQASDAAFQNAQNNMATQQFNANLGLQRNNQALSANQQDVYNRMQGINAVNTGNQMLDTTYQARQALLGEPAQYNWGNLSNYTNTFGAATQGTGQTVTPYYRNNTANTLGILAGAKSAGMF